MLHFALLPLASIEDVLIPVLAIGLPMMIPIVGIMAWHQQRMAQLVGRQDHSKQNDHDIAELRAEVKQLKDVVSTLVINLDSKYDRAQRDEIRERVGTGE